MYIYIQYITRKSKIIFQNGTYYKCIYKTEVGPKPAMWVLRRNEVKKFCNFMLTIWCAVPQKYDQGRRGV